MSARPRQRTVGSRDRVRPGILLALGYFGGRNTGDDAMLAGFVGALTEVERCRLVLMSREQPALRSPVVEHVPWVPLRTGNVIRLLCQAEAVVQVGGTVF